MASTNGKSKSQTENKKGTKYSGKLADAMAKANAPKTEGNDGLGSDKNVRRRLESGFNVVSPQDAAAVIGRYVDTDEAKDRFGTKNKAVKAYSDLVDAQQERLEGTPYGPRRLDEFGQVRKAGPNFIQGVFNQAAGLNPTTGMGILDSLKYNYNMSQGIPGSSLLGTALGMATGIPGASLLLDKFFPEQTEEGLNKFGMPIYEGRQIFENETTPTFNFDGTDDEDGLTPIEKSIINTQKEDTSGTSSFVESDTSGIYPAYTTIGDPDDPENTGTIQMSYQRGSRRPNYNEQGSFTDFSPSVSTAYNPKNLFNELGSQPVSQYSVLNDYDAEQDAINQMALADRLSLADMGFEGYMQESPFPGQALTNPEDIAFRENFINEQNVAEDMLGFKMDDLVDLRNITYDPSKPSTMMGYFNPNSDKIGMAMTKPGTFNAEDPKGTLTPLKGYSPFNTVFHEGLHSLFKESVPSGVEEFINRQVTTSAFPPGSVDDLNSIKQFSGYDLDDPSLPYMDEPDSSQYNQGLSASNLPNNQQLYGALDKAGFTLTDAFQDRFNEQPNTEDNFTTQILDSVKSAFGFNQGGLIPPESGPMSGGVGNLFKMR